MREAKTSKKNDKTSQFLIKETVVYSAKKELDITVNTAEVNFQKSQIGFRKA